jgi:hypothetical protein
VLLRAQRAGAEAGARQSPTRPTNAPAIIAAPVAPAAVQPPPDLGVGNTGASTVRRFGRRRLSARPGRSRKTCPQASRSFRAMLSVSRAAIPDAITNASGPVQGGEDGLSRADQNYIRPTATDTWWINDVPTIRTVAGSQEADIPVEIRQPVVDHEGGGGGPGTSDVSTTTTAHRSKVNIGKRTR